MLLKTIIKTLTFAVSISLVMGCTSTSKPQPPSSGKLVAGTDTDISKFAGSWVGEYTSTVTQRSGVVTFNLNKGTNKAIGQVILTNYATPDQNVTDKSTDKVLPIEFVGFKEGKTKGFVSPYSDPRFGGASVFTTFEGALNEDRMEGTFTSRIGQTGYSYVGTWWAVRQ